MVSLAKNQLTISTVSCYSMLMRKLKHNERGAVSLITVILLAIILSMITTGMLRLSIKDARQSTDDDLTNRAFFAAESGISDAVRFIREHLDDNTFDLLGDECAPPSIEAITNPETGAKEVVIGDPALDTAYTCQLIDLTPRVVSGTLTGSEDTAQIPLRFDRSRPAPTSVTIRWHNEDDSLVYAASAGRGKSLPQAVDWDFPAMLRANVFGTPRGSNFNAGDVRNYITFLNPEGVDEASGITAADGNIVNANCQPGFIFDGSYACEATLNIGGLFSSHDMVIRLSAIYRSARFSLTLNNGQEFVDTQAIVDVTGRSNDVYRRVRASVSLDDGVNLLPNTAIKSAEDICKLVNVKSAPTFNCP